MTSEVLVNAVCEANETPNANYHVFGEGDEGGVHEYCASFQFLEDAIDYSRTLRYGIIYDRDVICVYKNSEWD